MSHNSAFVSAEHERRYQEFFHDEGHRGRYWRLTDGELAAASVLLAQAPALSTRPRVESASHGS